MWSGLFGIVAVSLVCLTANGLQIEKLEAAFSRGLKDYMNTEIVSEELEYAISQLQFPRIFRNELDITVNPTACMACNVTANLGINIIRSGLRKDLLATLVKNICVWFNIETQQVCHGVVDLNYHILAYIIKTNKNLTSSRLCSIMMQNLGCKDPNRQDWTIQIPPKPSGHKEKTSAQSKSLKILQLTDVHYDPEYSPASNALCGEPMCCRQGSTPATQDAAAGFWGDYRECDLPDHTFLATLEHIASKHKDLDYVYFTGDIINHKVWDTNVQSNAKAFSETFSKIKRFFSEMGIYPILGNHESHPVNSFSSDGVDEAHLNTKWLYSLAADEWSEWLPADTRETILRGGYYTVLVKPGFRIVALNTNVCYTLNWWLLYDEVDPHSQLQWLVEVLLGAERSGEVVHILAHIPTSDRLCLLNWGREYVKIVNRFAHIIAAQFNGHTHYDELNVFFSSSATKEATNVAYNGGSLTPYTKGNPNYKIFNVDSDTMKIIDIETWTFNLTEANLIPHLPPQWYKLYSFKEAYGIRDFEPQTLAALTERMAMEPALTEKYYRYKFREADISMATGCNRECEINNLCSIVTSYPEITFHCDRLKELYDNHRPINTTIFT